MKKFITVELENGEVLYYVCEAEDLNGIVLIIMSWQYSNIIIADLNNQDLKGIKVKYAILSVGREITTGKEHRAMLCEDYRG